MTRILSVLLATAAFTAPAFADTALGLTGDKTLVMIDTSTAAVTGTVEVQGVNRLHGIDYRPGTMTVIGVTDEQAIVTIDPMTGATTPLSTMNTMMEIADGAAVIVDVNPAADRLRFMSGTTNHRINMDTGEVTVDGNLAWEAGDANGMANLMVAGTGYSNSYGKPEATAMYNIDTGLSALLRQTAPNDGTNATIGMLGAMIEGPVGFDIATTADGTNTAWLAANGALHTVDLETGAVLQSWPITGTDAALRDLTILPAM
ncbi:DUF4394 domain-containing protein [Pseudotabrizicola algicola]|uniref:DUF4394 domain-containing protein n=1 Tax=Pseudotabrizicola algicola TaxID=2709381 RepID=A0A6B3RSY5_9RHOB|nr:DUF4394 domain-containing protein [Pseudotabrizicola algicola]NEX47878.1 DUF4394 domain-containing protein [Pseudotabrizicola algicola]